MSNANPQKIEVRDVVLFHGSRGTGRHHQVSWVSGSQFTLCGFGAIVEDIEITLVRKAEPISTEFAGMTREQVRRIIADRMGLR